MMSDSDGIEITSGAVGSGAKLVVHIGGGGVVDRRAFMKRLLFTEFSKKVSGLRNKN